MHVSKRTALVAAAVAAAALTVPAFANPHNPQGGNGSGVACNDGSISWNPTNLWPPNHKFVPIHISYAENTGDSDNDMTSVTVDSVTEQDGANPPQDATLPSVNGSGDPHNSDSQPDTDPSNAPTMGDDATPATFTEDLRAERSGTDGHGSGRIYDLSVTCSDMGGTPPESESQTVHIQVSVPHDQGVVKP
jgi:hypothetical protein